MKSQDVLWFTNAPSPYRVDFFNELGKSYHLTVLFHSKKLSDRNKKWFKNDFIHFKGIYLKGINVFKGKRVNFGFARYIVKHKGIIVVADPMTLAGALTMFISRFLKKNIFIEGDGAYVKHETKLNYYLKKWILNGASFYFSTNDSHREYYLKYRVNPQKIIEYPFTSIFLKEVLRFPPNPELKNSLKSNLGLNPEFNILFVGQFIHRKGLDILVQTLNENPELTCVFVGGDKIQFDNFLRENNLKKPYNAIIMGFKSKKEVLDLYQACDVLVVPSREDIWGLVINEGISQGIPVICSNRCGAGERLIKHGENGFIFDVRQPQSLSKYLRLLLGSYDLRFKMSKYSLEIAQKYTIESMVKQHNIIFNQYRGYNVQ